MLGGRGELWLARSSMAGAQGGHITLWCWIHPSTQVLPHAAAVHASSLTTRRESPTSSEAANGPCKGMLSRRKLLEEKAHKHKLFALVDAQMALGQTAGCRRVNQARKFMCSPRNTGNTSVSLWLTGGLSQGCPNFQKVYVFKVYVPFSCPKTKGRKYKSRQLRQTSRHFTASCGIL